MFGVMCLVALLQLVRVFLMALSGLVFSAYRLCVLMCAVQNTLAKHRKINQ